MLNPAITNLCGQFRHGKADTSLKGNAQGDVESDKPHLRPNRSKDGSDQFEELSATRVPGCSLSGPFRRFTFWTLIVDEFQQFEDLLRGRQFLAIESGVHSRDFPEPVSHIDNGRGTAILVECAIGPVYSCTAVNQHKEWRISPRFQPRVIPVLTGDNGDHNGLLLEDGLLLADCFFQSSIRNCRQFSCEYQDQIGPPTIVRYLHGFAVNRLQREIPNQVTRPLEPLFKINPGATTHLSLQHRYTGMILLCHLDFDGQPFCLVLQRL